MERTCYNVCEPSTGSVRLKISSNGSQDATTAKEKGQKIDEDELLIFCCISLKNITPKVRFLICTFSVFVCYLLYGYFQELLFKLEGFKSFGLYLTLVQFLLYTFLAGVEMAIRQSIDRRVPLQVYAFLAFLTVGTMGLSNMSIGYLNYPTQVVFKSCKLIPVLIAGIFIQGKRYGILDFLAAGFMSFGLALFVLTDAQVSADYSAIGILMISGALTADAVIGNVQEKVMKHFMASSTEMVLFSYSIGAAYIFVFLLVTDELQRAVEFFSKNPLETYGYGAVFSITGYFGVQVVLTLVKTSGVFVAVTVTTCRKAVTIILSFLLFAKPFSFQYIWSGLIVILGIYLNIYSKQDKQNSLLIWFQKRYWSKQRSKPLLTV